MNDKTTLLSAEAELLEQQLLLIRQHRQHQDQILSNSRKKGPNYWGSAHTRVSIRDVNALVKDKQRRKSAPSTKHTSSTDSLSTGVSCGSDSPIPTCISVQGRSELNIQTDVPELEPPNPTPQPSHPQPTNDLWIPPWAVKAQPSSIAVETEPSTKPSSKAGDLSFDFSSRHVLPKASVPVKTSYFGKLKG
ncbi:hypothetical protein RCL1_006788 [Eukaryota sp. TZLM3-RCL]